MPNLEHFISIDKLLKNVNFLQEGTGKTPTTDLHNEARKRDFFDEIKDIIKTKITKQAHALKIMHTLIMLNYNLTNFDFLNLKFF